MTSWRVTVAVGTPGAVSTWESTDQTPAGPGLVDPLKIGHELPEGKPIPAQPEPGTAQFSVWLTDATEAAHAVPGAPVSLNYYSPRDAATPLLTFDGRIGTGAKLSPLDDGTVVAQLGAVGYLADLAGLPAHREGWPGRQAHFAEVIGGCFDAAAAVGLPGDHTYDPPTSEASSPVGWNNGYYWLARAESAEGVDALAQLLNALEVVVQGTEDRYNPDTDQLELLWPNDPWRELWGRYVAEPVLTGDGVAEPRTHTGWVLRGTYSPQLPAVGVLAPTATGWAVTVDPASPHPAVIPASRVERPEWTYGRSIPERVVVTPGESQYAAAVAQLGDNPGNTMTVATELPGSNNPRNWWGGFIATFYVAEAPLPPPWEAPELVWRYDWEPDGRELPELGQLVIVAGMRSSWVPLGRDYYPAVVSGLELELEDGAPQVTLSVVPFGHRFIRDPELLTWAELPATMTWADWSPSLTWAELRYAHTATA